MPGRSVPKPDRWKGGSEDFGFLRTFDGHVANDRVGNWNSDTHDHRNFGYSNVKWGFEDADIGGDDYDCYPLDMNQDED